MADVWGCLCNPAIGKTERTCCVEGTCGMSNTSDILFDIGAEHRYRRGYYHAMNHLLAALEPSLSLEQGNTLKLWLTNTLSLGRATLYGAQNRHGASGTLGFAPFWSLFPREPGLPSSTSTPNTGPKLRIVPRRHHFSTRVRQIQASKSSTRAGGSRHSPSRAWARKSDGVRAPSSSRSLTVIHKSSREKMQGPRH